MRTEAGWNEQRLTVLDDILVLPDFGLRCKVFEVYRGTALASPMDV
jgi:hypothetical protein